MLHFIRFLGLRIVARIGTLVVTLFVAMPALAGPIDAGVWYEFTFTDAGVPALGCFPNDPDGNFGIPSSGTPSTFLDAPPWTITVPGVGALLTVTDAFLSGDRFEIFDFGVSIGLTSAPAAEQVDTGDDPVPSLADPSTSHGFFALATGDHSITIIPIDSGGGGAAYFQVNNVPEPSALALIGLGAIGLLAVAQSGRLRGRTLGWQFTMTSHPEVPKP